MQLACCSAERAAHATSTEPGLGECLSGLVLSQAGALIRYERFSPLARGGAQVIGADALRLLLRFARADWRERKQDSEDHPNINAHQSNAAAVLDPLRYGEGATPIQRGFNASLQMGNSVAPGLGSGADYSRECPGAALSSRDQSATDLQPQARRRAAWKPEACRRYSATQIVRRENGKISVIAQPSWHQEGRTCATANAAPP